MALVVEKDAVVAALKASGGKVTIAADRLGVARRTLQLRMREYGIPEGRRGRPRRRITYREGARGGWGVAAGLAAVAGAAALALRVSRRAV